MFSIFEGDANACERKLQERLEILKRAREDGFFDEEPTHWVKIVADGHGPDDGWLPERNQDPPEHGERNPNPGGNTVTTSPAPVPQHQTIQRCENCDTSTRHITYGRGSPTWHCVICCTCVWCMASLERQFKRAQGTPDEVTEADFARVREQFARAERRLSDAVKDDVNYFYCTKCGAGLRCGVCNDEGTGNYCDLCGKRNGAEGFCTDCWKEGDKDG